MDLVEFLLARIAEDEAGVPPEYASEDYGSGFNADPIAFEVSPRRWLAECKAKRLIVEAYRSAVKVCELHADRMDGTRYQRAAVEATVLPAVMACLALPYASHPDFQPEWAPEITSVR